MTVWFGLLGPVEVRIDGRPVLVGPARQQCVLAVLLVEAGRLVTADRLTDRVWGELPPQRARASLHSYVSRLRQVLAAGGAAAVERQGSGYVLRTDPGAVDLHVFRDLTARARGLADGDAVGLYEEALALWRGEQPLGAVEGGWADEVRSSLRQERFAVELDRNDAVLRLGGHDRLLAGLAARAAEHPLDERLAGQLVLALFRSGRAAEALDAYGRIRAHLAEELGIDPGEPLRRLHQQVLQQDASLLPSLLPSRPPADLAPAPRQVPRQLPPTVRVLVGRDVELAFLHEQLDALEADPGSVATVIAISGVAGGGKTTLALAWARQTMDRFPDGRPRLRRPLRRSLLRNRRHRNRHRPDPLPATPRMAVGTTRTGRPRRPARCATTTARAPTERSSPSTWAARAPTR
ncbi:BTAD domain-containing putative transcriptional regulator [Streptomyces sp. NPDC058067]|uniref:AfsR/SARP family transcriptional regulator n=1 Tax=Streptomyces sp. NPDC058067 TaxID=3346324 RepID=UPI0036E012D5